MIRKIYNTLSFSKGYIHFSSIEKIDSNYIELYSKKANVLNAEKFIKNSVLEIEEKINIKIKKVNVIFENSKKITSNIILDNTGINIIDNIVAKKDIENIFSKIKSKYSKENEKVILIHPFEFEVKDLITKKYSKAPYSKKGNYLKIKSIVTTINKKIFKYITTLLKKCNLEHKEILFSDYANSLSKLSKNAIWKGSILIDIQSNYVNLTINKFGGTFDSFTIYDFGFEDLVRGIKNYFNCSQKDAINLIKVYGNLNMHNHKIIFSEEIHFKNKSFTNIELNKIINLYLSKLFGLIKGYLKNKRIIKLPIIFSKNSLQISGIKKKLQDSFENNDVYLYRPTSFIEKNNQNMNNLGLIKYDEIKDEILKIKWNETVFTNTKSVEIIYNKKQNSKSLFDKILNKIGVIHNARK